VVLAVVLFSLMQNRGTTPGATPDPNTQAGPTVPPDLTATVIAFATQSRPEVLPHIELTEAKALYDANDAKFIDVRLKDQYAAGHIQGAVNIPVAEVRDRANEIPRSGNVVVYCQ
jgi:3-mercaptopyruvate sulfurtransferase SseA